MRLELKEERLVCVDHEGNGAKMTVSRSKVRQMGDSQVKGKFCLQVPQVKDVGNYF